MSLGPTLKIFFTPWRCAVHTQAVDYSFSNKHQALKIQLTSKTLQFWYMPTVLIQEGGLYHTRKYTFSIRSESDTLFVLTRPPRTSSHLGPPSSYARIYPLFYVPFHLHSRSRMKLLLIRKQMETRTRQKPQLSFLLSLFLSWPLCMSSLQRCYASGLRVRQNS